MKNALVIINPKAGKNSARVNAGDIIKAFRSRGIECFEKTTICQGDATEIAEKYASSYDAVVCCGGDGTYNEVINGLMRLEEDKRPPIIYLPYGSTNDFANTMGLSKDPDTAAEMYLQNKINTFDVGNFNGSYFSYIAAFGVATQMSYETPQKFKNMFGHAAYLINGFILHILPILKSIKPTRMVIEHDGETIEGNFFFGAISNTNEISGIFKLDSCGVKMNDGLLEVLLVRDINVKGAFGVFNKMLRQDYTGDKIMLFKTKKLKVTSEVELPWALDGEYGGKYSVSEIEVRHNAINAVSPKSRFLV